MKKRAKYPIAFLLCAAMLFSCVFPAFAAVPVSESDLNAYVISAENKPAYVSFFNDTVNAVKTDLPYAEMTYTAGIPENGLVKDDGETTEAMDSVASSYIGAFFDGLFSERNSTFRSLLKTVLGADSVKNDSYVLHRGAKRNNSVPVYGKDYVSALKPAEDFDILVNQKKNAAYPSELAVVFRETQLADAENTSLPLVFTLPDGSIDAELISGQDKETQTFLSNIKFSDFKIKDARIVTRYDTNGKLSYYGSVITYSFSFTYFDMIKIMSAILGFDIYKMVIDTINTIFANLGNTSVNADNVLSSRKLYVTYIVRTEMDKLNFNPRFFGDVDDDGEVTAADAREALRHCVSLSLITDSEDQLYTDMDFDGEITSADARLILRTAVGLEEKFTEIPEGKTVRIIVYEEDHSTPEKEEEDPTEPGEEPDKEFKGLIDIDPSVSMSGLAQYVFDTIENFKNAESGTRENISGIVDIIRGIVNESREKNEK